MATPSALPPRRGRGRPSPRPNSILNREALMESLEQQNIVVSRAQLDGFYQALHRHHYPPLPVFVEQYYRNEQLARSGGGGGDDDDDDDHTTQLTMMPVKNAISSKKNKNRTQLPKPFLQFLQQQQQPNGTANNNTLPTNQCEFVALTSRIQTTKTSNDGSTTKLAVQLHDGQLVESVLMRYGPLDATTGRLKKCGRASLCVSSQCGCAMGCTFCATGTQGLTGDLHYSEILEQLIHAGAILAREAMERRTLLEQEHNESGHDHEATKENKAAKQQRRHQQKRRQRQDHLALVRNVVFMGMGEPLDNFTNVVQACRIMIDRRRFNLAHGRVTVSTVGIASQIRKLTREMPQVSLAVSLHAPNQALRAEIVPTAKNFPIHDIIDAMDGHMKAQHRAGSPNTRKQQQQDQNHNHANKENSARRRAMIEYVMLEGPTSTLTCAHELGKLCQDRQVVVNLIPYNKTDVRDKLSCPSPEHIRQFQHIVHSYGNFCTVRRTMGADIDSACGQLVVTANKNNQNGGEDKPVVPDIEDAAALLNVSGKNNTLGRSSSSSHSSEQIEIKQVMDDDLSNVLDAWMQRLQVATTIAATCFIVSSALYLRQQKRR